MSKPVNSKEIVGDFFVKLLQLFKAKSKRWFMLILLVLGMVHYVVLHPSDFSLQLPEWSQQLLLWLDFILASFTTVSEEK